MDPRFSRGIALFNHGHFFEAHEVWEEQWIELVGAEKLAVQGLIQIAAGYLKNESGVRSAAVKLLTRGSALLRNNAGAYTGIDVAAIDAAVQNDLARLQATPLDVATADLQPPLL